MHIVIKDGFCRWHQYDQLQYRTYIYLGRCKLERKLQLGAQYYHGNIRLLAVKLWSARVSSEKQETA